MRCHAVVAAVGVAAGVTVALVPVTQAGSLDVQITTVRAAERGPSDAQLVALRPRLRRLVGYRSYRVVQEQRRQCAWGNREAFTIPGGRFLHVMPKGMRDQAVLMQIQLQDGARALVDTDVRLQNRGVMLFSVGEDADGALLIIVRAED